MRAVGIDFETYWDADYTLRTLGPREYIHDARFDIIGVSIAIDDDEPLWIDDGRSISTIFAGVPWDEVFVYGHNLQFDGGILTWKFGVNPKCWLDTLAMARARVSPFTGSASLAKLSEYLGLSTQKGTYANRMRGVRKADMSETMLAQYGEYCVDDIVQTRDALRWLLPQFSADEVKLIDRTLRMYLEPKLQLDALKLSDHLEKVRAKKAALMAQVTASKKDLMSNEKFAEQLRGLGVEPPVKISPTTGEETYAFAKKDLAFLDLKEHPDERVQALVAARLGVKSTLEETRTMRLLGIASEFVTLAVPLLYAGAHTGRMSGGGKLNLQNLTRGSGIRYAIMAIDGRILVVADASQIEARILAWFCGQTNIVVAFANGEDVYSVAASGIFNEPVTKTTHPFERQVGKVATLQLGYGSSAGTFWHMCKVQDIDLDPLQAERITAAWRANNPHIVSMWYKLYNRVKWVFTRKTSTLEDFQCIQIGYDDELSAGYIVLPGGYRLWYPNPGHVTDRHGRTGFGYWKAKSHGGYWKTLWHGEIMNNVIQALARVVTMGHALQISDYPAAPWVLQVHDELVFAPKVEHADAVAEACKLVMRTPPHWCPGLPLDTDVAIAKSYGEAK